MPQLGIISDTHGLLRPQAIAALRGCDAIIHAGDVGAPSVLEELRELAPLFVVRGNVDRDAWAENLPQAELLEMGNRSLYILRDLADLDLDPRTAQIHAVIFGHTHQPRIEWRQDVLYLNPGSAGPRRFNLPVTLALLDLRTGTLKPKIINLIAPEAPLAPSG
jgi:uncharacterized protein